MSKISAAIKDKNFIGSYDTVVEVTYELDVKLDTKKYFFKTTIDSLKPGDYVIVDAKTGLNIVEVVRVYRRSLYSESINAFNRAKAWVVDKINMEEHNKRIEATQRKKFIVTQLKERREQMEEIAIYKMLAKQDKEAAALLDELQQLEGSK